MLAPFKIDLSHIRSDRHISFTSCDAISQICAPLFKKFSLNEFSHSRVYEDGSRAELWSDPRALEHTFLIKDYLVGIYSPALIGEERYSMYEYKVQTYPRELNDRYNMQLHDQKVLFNHDNCFLINHKSEGFMEYFLFYTPIKSQNTLNTYLNNLDELEKFISYYKYCARDIIEKSENQKLIPAWRDSNIITHSKSLFFSKDHDLTLQESRVASLIVQGKSAKQMSNDLLISKKTVEQHIVNIKIKLNGFRKSDVIEKLYRIGIRPEYLL